jgi:hypothetical protein
VLLPQLSSALSLSTATDLAGTQTGVMRSMLLAKAADLEQFKLQFNCCGTGVEKVCTICNSYKYNSHLEALISMPPRCC